MRPLTTALVGMLVFAACEKTPPAETTAKASAAKRPTSAVLSVGARSAGEPQAAPAPAWPPLPSQSVDLADDLLARNFYVVLDGSGSMSDRGCSGSRSKAVVAVEAVAEFARALPAGANVGLLTFDRRGIAERLPLGNRNREAFVQQVKAIQPAGGTPLRTAIERGYRALSAQAQRQAGYGEYHLVVVTDGMPDPASEHPRGVVNEMLAVSPVVLHTIGFCIGEDHALNQPGRTLYRAANNPAELGAGLKEVLAEAESFAVSSF